MSRATISVERVDFDPADQTVTVHEKQEQPFSETESYPIMDFLVLLACHIPSTYESLVYYYGIYSSSYPGKEKKEETIRPPPQQPLQCWLSSQSLIQSF